MQVRTEQRGFTNLKILIKNFQATKILSKFFMLK